MKNDEPMMIKRKINRKWELMLPNRLIDKSRDKPWKEEGDEWDNWEYRRLQRMSEIIKPGMTIMDIGAEEGDMSALFAKWAGNDGRMIIIEPSSEYWPLIKATFEANKLKPPVASFVGFGSDKIKLDVVNWVDKKIVFGWPKCCDGLLKLNVGFRHFIDNAKIPEMTVDNIALKIGGKIDVITMDVEGAELKVLRGMMHILRTQNPYIFISLHERYLREYYQTSVCAVLEFFKKLDYTGEYIDVDHEIHFLFKKRESKKTFPKPVVRTKQKVFGVGVSRTGTDSLTFALRNLGYKAHHWPRLSKVMSMAERYDALTDTTICVKYKELAKKYPTAKFILTTREIEGLLDSIKQLFIAQRRDNLLTKVATWTKDVHGQLYGMRMGFDRDTFREHILNYEASVKDYFKDSPERLLVLDLKESDKMNRLCDFLGLSHVNYPFPNRNNRSCLVKPIEVITDVKTIDSKKKNLEKKTIPIKSFGSVGSLDQQFLLNLVNKEGSSAQFTANSYDFEFRDSKDNEGGIIWVGGNYSDPDKIQEQINRMPWVLLFVLSDEENKFPYEQLNHNDMKIWLQNAHGVRSEKVTKWLGCFPSNACRDELKKIGFIDKDMNWSFNGQCNHAQREDCVRVLEKEKKTDCFLKTSKLFNKGSLSDHEYFNYMARSRIIPCPSGIQTADSFRFFESLEAGCLPVPDKHCSKDPVDFNFWENLFKPNQLFSLQKTKKSLPFPIIKSEWSEFSNVLINYEDKLTWIKDSNRCFAFWQKYKRDLIKGLYDTIKELSGTPPKNDLVKDKLTILISTSSIPSHPSTAKIEETINSLKKYDELKDAEIIIMIDEVSPEFKHREVVYEEYIRRLLWKCNFEWKNILPIITPQWLHQANTTKHCIEYVKTKNVLFVEHDCPLVGKIPFSDLCNALDDPRVNHIRLHFDSKIHPAHQHLMLGKEIINDVPLIKTIQWSQRPHLMNTKKYRSYLKEYFNDSCRTMIEDLIYSRVVSHLERDHGVWIYAPDGDMKRSTTNDGREHEPKGKMWFK